MADTDITELADSMLESLEEKLREQIDFEIQPSIGTVEGWLNMVVEARRRLTLAVCESKSRVAPRGRVKNADLASGERYFAAENERLREALKRAAYIAEHLLQQVPEFTGVIGPAGEREDDHIRDSIGQEILGWEKLAGGRWTNAALARLDAAPGGGVAQASQESGELPKVYCWCNSGAGTDLQLWYAMAEDGEVVTSHICSHESWARTDLLDRKRDLYDAKFGGHIDGQYFLLVWEVAPAEVYERNQALRRGSVEALLPRVEKAIKRT